MILVIVLYRAYKNRFMSVFRPPNFPLSHYSILERHHFVALSQNTSIDEREIQYMNSKNNC